MQRRIGGRALAALLVVLLAAAACGGSDDSGGGDASPSSSDAPIEPVPGGTLTIARHSENDSWDPTSGQWQGSTYVVANAIFDPLMALDENDTPRPYLAESLESNDDFTEWTLTMRPDIMFHNGDVADADAVVANLEAHRASVLTGLPLAPVATVEAVDDLTVVITMSRPWSTFPRFLAAQIGYLMAPSTIGADEAASSPVGTGPFVFDSWVRDGDLIVTKNENYWQDGYPLVDRIEFPVIIDANSRAQALRSGDAEVIPIDAPAVGELAGFDDDVANGSIVISIDDEGDTTDSHLVLNTQVPPFDDPLAREILAYGLDRNLASEVGYEGLAPPASGLFSPDSIWYAETDYPEPDEVKAAELAAEYEAKYGEPLSLEVLVPPGNDVATIAQLLDERAGAFGIDVDIVPLESTTHITRTLTGDFQASAFAIPFTGHPDSSYIMLHSDFIAPPPGLGLNGPGFPNDAIDAALDAARTTDDFDEQYEQYAIVQQELADDMTRIWIVHNTESIVADAAVQDLTSWTFPDGTPGQGQIGVQHRVHQLWLTP